MTMDVPLPLTESQNKPVLMPVQLKAGFLAASAARWSTTVTLPARILPMGWPETMRVLRPNSEGMKRLTPAASAASASTFWPATAGVATAETTACWPCRAAVRESRDSY